MKEVLEVIIKNLVDNPNGVSVVEREDAKGICYEVKVDSQDMGKVIGKQGKMAKAIRSVVRAVAGKTHKKVNVEFLD